MPRKIDKTCVACAQLSAAEAREVHGKDGDGCWVEKRCKRRRSHYRNRKENNEQRRLQYRQEQSNNTVVEPVETISLAVAEETMTYANLYIWRERRKDAPLHAIAASVFQNGKKVLEVEPIHCAGYRRRQIENYVHKEIMPYLNARYGITYFAEEIRLEPMECKIKGCPYHDRPEPDQSELSQVVSDD
ncbi:MAG: hypothetical protein AAFQ63_14995 [Cyanobacteria bacterium J06621_11]